MDTQIQQLEKKMDTQQENLKKGLEEKIDKLETKLKEYFVLKLQAERLKTGFLLFTIVTVATGIGSSIIDYLGYRIALRK